MEMKIIPEQTGYKKLKVNNASWVRHEYNDNSHSWSKVEANKPYDPTPEQLETEYQKLINKPVTTTNELPLSVKICEAIVNTPDNASTARLWATLAEISDLCKGK